MPPVYVTLGILACIPCILKIYLSFCGDQGHALRCPFLSSVSTPQNCMLLSFLIKEIQHQSSRPPCSHYLAVLNVTFLFIRWQSCDLQWCIQVSSPLTPCLMSICWEESTEIHEARFWIISGDLRLHVKTSCENMICWFPCAFLSVIFVTSSKGSHSSKQFNFTVTCWQGDAVHPWLVLP